MVSHTELLAWISDLQTGLYINCVYCGHRYGPKTEELPAEALRKHVATCPEHPMAHLVKSCRNIISYIDSSGKSPEYIKALLMRAIKEATQ